MRRSLPTRRFRGARVLAPGRAVFLVLSRGLPQISTAAAQAAGAPAQPNALMQFLPLVLIFVVFYFLLIRPQTKRAKEHRAMVAALGVGAEVVTSGGILGKITEVSEQFVTLEIAPGVNIKVQRHAVSQELPKGTLKSA